MEYVEVLWGGRWSVGMCWSHVVCIVVSRGVVSLGSFLCSVVEGRSKVALRVSMEVLREVLPPDSSPLGKRASMTLVGWICSV